MLKSAQACEIVTADLTNGEYEDDQTIDGDCVTITPGCSQLGNRAFKDSNVDALTVQFASSDLQFGNGAFSDLRPSPGDVTVIRMCDACTGGVASGDACSGSGNNACPCNVRPLSLGNTAFSGSTPTY
eukprot:scaffold77234_cov66-Phaeocystis_antarctica.AAC.5